MDWGTVAAVVGTTSVVVASLMTAIGHLVASTQRRLIEDHRVELSSLRQEVQANKDKIDNVTEKLFSLLREQARLSEE